MNNKEEKTFAEVLEDIIETYENTRSSFKEFIRSGDGSKNSFLEFQTRFTDIKADLRPFAKKIAGEYEKRSDKQATAIKFRIAVAIHEGEFKDDEGKLIYDECSINQAEKFASASTKYKEFLKQKSFFKESYVNIRDIREDINTYINLIKDYLK